MREVNVWKSLKLSLAVGIVGLAIVYFLAGFLAPLLGTTTSTLTAWVGPAGFVVIVLSAFVADALGKVTGWY